MKLFYLLFEALNINTMRQLKIVASELDIPEDKLASIINDIDPTNKYVEWVLRQIRFQNIRVPEDNNRVKEVINQFKQHQSRLPQRDLNQYKTIHDVEEALDTVTGTGSKREGAFQVNPEELPGVKLINQDGDYKLWEVSDPESLAIMGEGTKWCTRKSYKDCQAKSYIDDQTVIYIISQSNTPIIQFTPDFEQVMDRSDNSIDLTKFTNLLKPLEYGLIFDIREAAYGYPDPDDNYMLDTAMNYVSHTWKRLPQVEQFIMKSSLYAVDYAYDIIKGRWPEAEPYILKNADAACTYAMNVIKGRWPEAEQIIMKSDYAVKYAINIIDG